jgi:hypothetical protein
MMMPVAQLGVLLHDERFLDIFFGPLFLMIGQFSQPCVLPHDAVRNNIRIEEAVAG